MTAAALDVVQRRLERQGLGDAVLELHSNKADRKSVLTQLGRSWDRASRHDPQEWVRVTEDLRLTRDQLNAYVDALHRHGTQGFSVYQAIGRTAQGAAPFALSFAGKDSHDAESWRRLRELAEEVGQRYRVVSDLGDGGPLALIAPGEWSFGWQDAFLAAARRLRTAMQHERTACRELAAALGYPQEQPLTPELTTALAALPAARLGRPAVSGAGLAGSQTFRTEIPMLSDLIAQCAARRQELSASYADDIISEMPLEALELQWREAQTKMWPLAGIAKGKVQKLLQSYAHSGTADPAQDIPALRRLLRLQEQIAASPLSALPGFAGEATDPAAMALELDEAEAYLRLEASLAVAGISRERLDAGRAEWTRRDGGKLEPALRRMAAAGQDLAVERAAFAAAGGLPDAVAMQAYLATIDGLQSRFPDWMKWLATRQRAMASGLAPMVEALEAGDAMDDTTTAFECAYMTWWLRLAMDASPVLRGFAHWEHDALIARFRALDEAMTKMAADEVMRRLGNDLPVRDSVPRNSELGTLRHQLGLQRPTLAIRSLVSQMPTTFSKLAPCVLMSPLSVAQYLPAGQAQFDLVIFDEASQISTWDAIGAIARGRQAIIVGDPKQLPPTNFFGRSDDGSEAVMDIAEFEKDMPSILDEVAAAGIPTHRLNWHYRSRDEALIAFSNHFYYDGGLVTFPSPDASGQAVRLHRVAGTYLRGQGRTNPEEARAIVRLIRNRLSEWICLPEDKRPTLGVITFNAQQQSLILDLLDAERKADPAIEWFFADDREEPLIVKNLENIQGDERDVMLFSITFGPDQAGKISMAFGALNGDGGEKRLNVAVTRARAELHVFSSITADQIDLGRTRARGVKDLKAFLDFAARGAIALAAQDSGSVGPVESPFEEAVRDALAARGWEVHSQIGVSGFRIDLGMRHPDHAGAWLAGVECDGASYHGSATARDRDRIRQAVLEGLGWSILRIWSTDWFRNPDPTLDRVDAALRDLLERDRARRAAEAVVDTVAAAGVPNASPDEPVVEVEIGSAEGMAAETPEIADAPAQSAMTADAAQGNMAAEQPLQFARNVMVPAVDASAEAQEPEQPGTSAQETAQPDADRFFDADYTPVLAALIQKLARDEGPLTEAALARRVSQLHGWQRTGGRIQARVAEMHRLLDIAEENGVRFFWPKEGIAGRKPFRGLAGRSLREISRTEIAWMEDQYPDRIAAAEDPVLELSRLLGIARLSQDARAYIEACRAWRHAGDGSAAL